MVNTFPKFSAVALVRGTLAFLAFVSIAGFSPRVAGQNFVLASSPSIDGYQWMITGDFNGDGKPDFVTLSFGNPSYVDVETNNGDGSGNFSLGARFTVGSYAQSVTAADVNGDHSLDLITQNELANEVLVFTNHGNATFGPATIIPVGADPRSVVATNFGRGFVDMVVANYAAHSLSLFTNDGTGQFASNVTYNLSGSPQTVIAADVNGDSKPDLVVAVQSYVGVTILTNDGAGGFAFSATYNLGQVFPMEVAAADLNGDHKLDIVALDFTGSVFVLTNSGAGQFAVEPAYSAPNNTAFTLLDVNNDGVADIVFSAYTATNLGTLTNNGAGIFAPGPNISIPSTGGFVVSDDVNTDGRLDLIAGLQSYHAAVLINTIVIPPPTLEIRATTTNSAILTWALSATNYMLQQNTNLTATNWNDVADPVDSSSGTNQVVVPLQSRGVFYRLVK